MWGDTGEIFINLTFFSEKIVWLLYVEQEILVNIFAFNNRKGQILIIWMLTIVSPFSNL